MRGTCARTDAARGDAARQRRAAKDLAGGRPFFGCCPPRKCDLRLLPRARFLNGCCGAAVLQTTRSSTWPLSRRQGPWRPPPLLTPHTLLPAPSRARLSRAAGAHTKEERYDAVDNFQYELPSDFEDEEITSESEGEEGAGGKGGGGGESDVDSEELAAELFGAGGGEGSDEEGDYEDEGSESDDGEEQEAESEEEDVMAYAGDAEEGGDAAHAAMLAEALGGGSTRRRRDVDVLTAGARESAAALTGTGEMSVDAIAAAMGGAGGAASTADARKLLRRVARRAAEGAAVAAPLPANVAARLARKAGYEASKAELGGWQDMVQRNRQAATEDLRAKPTAQGTSTAALGAKFTPKASGVEADVGDLLSAAGLTEERAAAAAEALELNELAAEEVTERQSKLSRMRNLMFYHEVKAKRAKKIKSRAYHKHLKKQALKEGNLALDDVELEDTEEARRELAQRREFERLEERLTLKHKNTGKWAKQMLKAKLGGHNTSVRQAVAEQLRLNQALTRKMDSMRDEEDSSSEEEEDEEAETGKDRRAASVAALEELVNEEEGTELPSKGLFSLPFMKRAIEKKRQAAQQEAKEMLREMDEMEADEDDDSEGDEGDGARGGGVRRAAADQDDDEVRSQQNPCLLACERTRKCTPRAGDEDTTSRVSISPNHIRSTRNRSCSPLPGLERGWGPILGCLRRITFAFASNRSAARDH